MDFVLTRVSKVLLLLAALKFERATASAHVAILAFLAVLAILLTLTLLALVLTLALLLVRLATTAA